MMKNYKKETVRFYRFKGAQGVVKWMAWSTQSSSNRNMLLVNLFLFFGLFLIPRSIVAQSLLEETFERFQYIQPKSGAVLSSFGSAFDLEGMNGEPGGDTINYERGQEAWRLGLLNQYGIKKYDSMRLKMVTRQQQFIANGVLPIGLVDIKYMEVNPAIEREGRVKVDDDSFYRLNLLHFKEQVYQEKYLFSVILPVERVRSDVQFAVLDSQLMISNFSDWRKLKWKWVMNGRTLDISWNTPFLIPRDADGGEVLGFLMAELGNQNPRVDLLESPYLLNGTRVIAVGTFFRMFFNFKNGSAPDILAQNDLSVHYYVDPQKPSMKAMYTVHMGYGDFGKIRTCIEKPLIMVEGVDYGYPGYPAGFKDQKYGENGYIDLLKGQNWDVPSQIWKNWESIKEAPGAIEKLRKAGFDIVYVDFWDGAQDMNHNAEVLIEVIKKIQERMCAREMHVLGVSMGGVVAKRALRLMENRGINHCVLSLTTFDSPHQGANLPLGLQNSIKYFKGMVGVCDDLFHRILRRPATLQLLVNHEISEFRSSSARSLWVREDSLFGSYPQKPWLFAIGNGSSEGNKANMNYSSSEKLQSGMTMMRLQLRMTLLFGWVNNYVADIYAENFFDRKTGKYYNGRLNFLKKFISHKDNIMWDHAPGSMVKQFQLFEELGKSSVLKTPFLTEESCFIPTVSSLDLTSGTLDNNSIIGKDFKKTSGNMTRILTNDMHTPFHRVYIPEKNQLHIQLDTSRGGNIAWLIEQLLSVSGVEDPHTVTDSYNLRSPHLRTLKGINVFKHGLFELNGVGDFPAVDAKDSVLAISAEERVFYAGDCAGANFSVRDSGLFLLGKHLQSTRLVLGGRTKFEVEHNGELRVVKGTNTLVLGRGASLWLKDDAILRIEDGSRLILEEGSLLRISDRAKIYLEGSGSLLHIKGILHVDSGVYFRPIPGVDGKVGLVKFTNLGYGYGEAEIISEGGRMGFEGNGPHGSRNLQIEGNLVFPEAGSGKALSRIEITRSVVCFGPMSRAVLRGSVSVSDSRMEAVEWATSYCGGFRYVGSGGIFKNLMFKNQDTALYYEQEGTRGVPLFSGNRFESCAVGMHLESAKFHVQKSFFEKNETALSIHNIWKEGVVEGSKFYTNKQAIQVENESETYGKLLTLNNEFYENQKGYTLNRTLAYFNCQRFGGNEKGIVAEESSLRLDGAEIIDSELLGKKFRAGVNVFSNHTLSSLELKKAELWADGYNYFHYNASQYRGQHFIHGDFRLVKTASYYKDADASIDLGSNRFFPSNKKFDIDSLNAKYVKLSHQGNPVKVSAYLMTEFEGATCHVESDSKDLMQLKYGQWDESFEDEEPIENRVRRDRCFGVEGAVMFKEAVSAVWIYDVQGKLIQKHHALAGGEQIKMPGGIYLIRSAIAGDLQTDKVFIHP